MRRCRNFTPRMWWACGVARGDVGLRTLAFLPPRPFISACTGRVGAHCAPKTRTCLPYSLIAPPIFSLLGPIHHQFFNPAEIVQPLTDHILFSYPLCLAMGYFFFALIDLNSTFYQDNCSFVDTYPLPNSTKKN